MTVPTQLLTANLGFIPSIVFPFVKLFSSASGGAGAAAGGGPETLFELLATLLVNWARGWFERFPHPPLGVLVRMQVGVGTGAGGGGGSVTT